MVRRYVDRDAGALAFEALDRADEADADARARALYLQVRVARK